MLRKSKRERGKKEKEENRKEGKLVPNPDEVLGCYTEDSYLSRVKIHVLKSCYRIIITY